MAPSGSSVALLARVVTIFALFSLGFGFSMVQRSRPSSTLLRPSASVGSPLARSLLQLQMCSVESQQTQQPEKLECTGNAGWDDAEQFDLVTSLLLAGYSFEVYNEPPIGKLSITRSDVKTVYTSTEYTEKVRATTPISEYEYRLPISGPS
jgi:hypothetical protein